MNKVMLTEQEMDNIVVGEAITVAGVMALVCAVIMSVVIYKLFTSSKGTTTIPGGFKFTWN